MFQPKKRFAFLDVSEKMEVPAIREAKQLLWIGVSSFLMELLKFLDLFLAEGAFFSALIAAHFAVSDMICFILY